MTTYDYRIGPCYACNQRSMAAYRCARLAELLLARMGPIDYFDRLLDEIVDNYAAAFAVHPPQKEFIH